MTIEIYLVPLLAEDNNMIDTKFEDTFPVFVDPATGERYLPMAYAEAERKFHQEQDALIANLKERLRLAGAVVPE